MVSIVFDMRGKRRFGEIEKKIATTIQATNSCLHVFSPLLKTLWKFQIIQNHSIVLGNDQAEVNFLRPCSNLKGKLEAIFEKKRMKAGHMAKHSCKGSW